MAIIGFSTTTSNYVNRTADRIGGGVFTAPASGAFGLPKILCAAKSAGNAVFTVGIYEVSGSTLGDLIGETIEHSVTKSSSRAFRGPSAWAGATPAMTAGAKYSIQVHSKDANLILYRDTGGGVGVFVDADYDSGLPDPFPSSGVTTNTSKYRMYCDVIPGSAPNAVVKVSPADETVIDPAVGNVFRGAYSNDLETDVMAAVQWRYRRVGTTSWTESEWETTPICQFTVPGGTLPTGYNYIVDSRAKDQLGGLVGPWMTSPWLITATALPDIPTITSPANGATITDWYDYLDWTAPNQDAYRAQVYEDDGDGGADTESVLFDSEAQESADVRSLAIDYSEWNDQTVHPAVAVRYGEIWTEYAIVSVDVAFTGPMQPTCTIEVGDQTGIMEISATHPEPTGGEPEAIAHDIYVARSDNTSNRWRIAAGVGPADAFRWRDWARDIDYTFWVRALAADGTSTWSEATT